MELTEDQIIQKLGKPHFYHTNMTSVVFHVDISQSKRKLEPSKYQRKKKSFIN